MNELSLQSADLLKGKVALVTGAGRGIGAAISTLLVSRGAHVLGVSRSQEELSALKLKLNEIEGAGRFEFLQADIGSEEKIRHLYHSVLKRFNRLDLVINNAGYIQVRKLTETSLEDWNESIRVNLTGVFLSCREAFQRMTAGGVIVNLSSLGGLQNFSKFEGFAAYSAAKAGVVALSQVLAIEGKARDIRVNCVAPGAVQTRMLEQALPGFVTSTTPEDMAKIVVSVALKAFESGLTGAVVEAPSPSLVKVT